MSRSSSVIVGVALMLGGASAEAKGFEALLQGDYAFTGEAACLVSQGGFKADGTPVDPPARFPQVSSFSVQGVRTFNGDGSGTLVARVISISHPFTVPANPAVPGSTPLFNRGSVSSLEIQSEFTYSVTPDLRLEIVTPVVTGTILSGPRQGQTLSFTGIPRFHGFISDNLRSLTLAHEEPGVEVHSFSNGDTDQRMCHRSRILHERKTNHRGGKGDD